MAGEMAAVAALRKMEEMPPCDKHSNMRERLPEVGGLRVTPPHPTQHVQNAQRLGHSRHRLSAGQPETVPKKEDRQVLGRADSLDPQNKPVAIYKADNVSCLETGLREWHLLTLIPWNPFKIHLLQGFTSQCSYKSSGLSLINTTLGGGRGRHKASENCHWNQGTQAGSLGALLAHAHAVTHYQDCREVIFAAVFRAHSTFFVVLPPPPPMMVNN